MLKIFLRFLPFWLFLAIYKGALLLHYTLIPVFGQRLIPVWAIGFVVGGEALLQLVLDVPAGHLVDRVGQRRMLKLATPIFFISAILLLFKLSLVTYLASVFFSVFGWLFLGPGVNAYILAHAKKDTSGAFMSLRDSAFSAGVVISGVGLPFVLMLSQQTTALVLLATSAVGIFFLSMSPPDSTHVHHEEVVAGQHRHMRRHWLDETLPAFKKLNPASGMLVLHMFSGAMFYSAVWFVVPLIIAMQPHNLILGFGLSVFDISIVLLGFAIGMLVDRGNKRELVFFGMIIFALAGALSGIDFGVLFLIFGFLASTGDETTILSLWSWLHSLDKEHAHDGVMSGVISLAEDFGYVVGPITAGVLYGIVGPTWTIVCGAIPIALTWIVYRWVVYAKHQDHMHVPGIRSIVGTSLRRRHARKTT